MFALRRPTEEQLRRQINEQARLPFTYAAVGTTNEGSTPRGFNADHARFQLGSGEQTFARAKESLRRWAQFNLSWGHAFPADTPIEEGRTVAVAFHSLGLWCVGYARIVYVIDEPRRFGFAYGTLPGHMENGEEQFLIERADDGTVWYSIRAFSRPKHVLTWLGYPYVRRLQKRFVRESAEAMRRAVASV